MVLNRFNLLVFIQLILIAFVGILIVIALQKDFMIMTTAGLVLLWTGLIAYLNFYINRIHRDVRKFMEALGSQDTSQFFNDQKAGPYFKKLYNSFNEISRNFRLVRVEKEVENQFYREIMKQSPSGIIAFAEDKSVKLVNAAALEIIGMEKLGQLTELRDLHGELAELIDTGDIGGFQIKLLVNKKMVQVAVKAAEMNLDGEAVRIITLVDISREITRSEIEAWQKLIRVLHHEITNSVVPLHILSTSLFDLFYWDGKQKSPGDMDDETIDRVVLGLKTLVKRSGGLKDFITNYKSFTSIEEPVYTTISMEELFSRILTLMEDDLSRSGVTVQTMVSAQGLHLMADEKLVEQTLINLLKNSLSALEARAYPKVRLSARQSGEHLQIEVHDNGKGIPEENIENIFTPFFTTRKGGSGIGLSLARQVMLMHNGSIQVSSVEGEQSTFTLTF